MTLSTMRYQGDALTAHANGGCYVCLRGDGLVDLDVQIVGEGILTLCKGCITEAAQVAGLHFNVAAVADMQIQYREEQRAHDPAAVSALTEQVAIAEAALNTAENTIATLQDVVDRLGSEPRSARKHAPRGKTFEPAQ